MPVESMVATAFDLAIGSYPDADREHPAIEPVLIVRESTAAAPEA
jgi:hypothetical protein